MNNMEPTAIFIQMQFENGYHKEINLSDYDSALEYANVMWSGENRWNSDKYDVWLEVYAEHGKLLDVCVEVAEYNHVAYGRIVEERRWALWQNGRLTEQGYKELRKVKGLLESRLATLQTYMDELAGDMSKTEHHAERMWGDKTLNDAELYMVMYILARQVGNACISARETIEKLRDYRSTEERHDNGYTRI